MLYGAARLDRRARIHLLPRELLNIRRPVGAGLFTVFTLAIATTGFWAYGPLILKILFDTPPLISGYILAGESVAWSLATMAVASAPVSADRALIRAGVTVIAFGAAGFAIVVPADWLLGIVGCALLQGFGFGLCWPSVIHRIVRLTADDDRPLAAASPSTVQRLGYSIGTAATGIAANIAGLADGISIQAARAAAFWVFAAFIPLLGLALLGAWVFTTDADAPSSAQPVA